MAAILKVAVAHPIVDTEYPNGTNIFSTTTPRLISVIAVNKSEEPQHFHIYTVPAGEESNPEAWGHLVFNLPISAYNAYETFRFGLNPNDSIYVAGSAQISYFVQGITQ